MAFGHNPKPRACKRCRREFMTRAANQLYCAECKPIMKAQSQKKADGKRKRQREQAQSRLGLGNR